ncbi:spoIIIJ-associated protein [Mobilisporobacter senegalensis]|uniref:RNA-binding protein KhpB n=2 Tax=Mobilisporobacter senegalensis TaxID=1329262 RepID=A0A3N1X5T2_9FIRM|nr:spoIIIJ-associated protein [Mobilisporobacter senegalensis]
MMDWVVYSAKTVDEALTEALIEMNTTSDKIEYEVIEKETNGILGFFSKPAKIRVRTKNTIEGITRTFLEKLFKAMNIDSKIDIVYDEENGSIDIDISGEDMGILIGKRGQTLDSLQYLTSLVVNKESNSYLKVKIDTENYRERRKETLENLAKNISFKVKRTKRAVSLEPMNPYERRVIHSALQNDKFVETHSEGEEPFRRVVVTLKKTANSYKSNTNKSYNKDYNRSYKRDNNYSKESNKEKSYFNNTDDNVKYAQVERNND